MAASSRDRLLDAAARVFAERGYQAASVDDVAAQAGLSKGAVYWNFKSKDDLFLTLYEERIGRRLRDMVELTQSAPTDEPASEGVNQQLLQVLVEERDLVLLSYEYWSLAMRRPELRARYVERNTALRSGLARALEERQRQLGAPEFSVSADDVATAFVALGSGLAMMKLADPDGVADGLFGEILSLVYDGLVARAARGA